jgi:glycolate oxidase FAD binding subunit
VVVKAPSVEKPATAEELANVLREAATSGEAVTPVGGGRALQMGGVLERCDVELHTTALDRVIEHSPEDMVVSVEAGITLEALQDHLAKSRQFLPLDPFNSPGHTIGGLLATGLTGPLRLRYGSPRDYLIGIRAALPDGRLASAGGRVVKNVSGYDLMKLHFGAMGSLGVIVAASFKVFPAPLHDVTVAAHGGWDDAERALSLPLPPSALELSADGKVIARFHGSPDAVKRVITELGWETADPAFWAQHSLQVPMTLIAAPRDRLHGVLAGLSHWWASPGTGIAHWTPAAGEGAEQLKTVREKAEAAGGKLVVLNASPGFVRAVGAWGTPPPTIDVMRRLKDAFDPHHALNPGRFLV